ncbi:DUF305 domain-containing protein [Citricoccus sp.]|uniref:DUF305 domain-containing protein n=1 Tax=Citricoccus sp. TaxID=1978372 RepID=UPI0026193309|nr:DUF305 domain-containing protein [Citricoccus sp.]HRO30122.1 DUF305 domain-containing protein [Citricoccus sp.]
MKRTTTLTGLALTAALALTACGGTDTSGGTGTTSTPTTSAAEASPTPTRTASGSTGEVSAEHNDADVMFAQMMIPHHQQAVEMSEMLLGKTDIPAEVTEFAQQVIDAQGPEIDRMHTMLDTWGASAASEAEVEGMDHGAGTGSGMTGMMSDEDMRRLDQAQGTEAARLYLEQMTTHHEGAVEMAREQVETGQNPQAQALAQEVIDAQQAEIAQMRTMLDSL